VLRGSSPRRRSALIPVSTARVATERPALYLRQLCQHFADARERHGAQEFDVAFDDHEGLIDFAPVVSGTCRLNAGQEGVLMVEASGSDQATLERVQRIVTRHLERFGRTDGLTVEWGPASERPATG
jgi:hypothetical protein